MKLTQNLDISISLNEAEATCAENLSDILYDLILKMENEEGTAVEVEQATINNMVYSYDEIQAMVHILRVLIE